MNKIKAILLLIILVIFITSILANKESNPTNYNISDYKCIGCQACVDACPVQAISIKGGKAIIDQTKCIQCGICVNGNYDDYNGCPVKAIIAPLEEDELNDEDE